MIFSVTERGTFRRCKRQAVLASKNGDHLTVLVQPLNLNVGTLMHHGFERWLLEPEKDFVGHVLDASVAFRDAMTKRYKAQVGIEPGDEEMLSIYEAVDLCLKMAENYQLRWGSPLPDGYRLVKPEQKIQVAVPGTEHACETCSITNGTSSGLVLDETRNKAIPCPDCDGNGRAVHYLQARLDAIFQHIATGRLDIDEHKTYGQRPRKVTLRNNDQFKHYVWAVSKQPFQQVALPKIAYDGLWKRKEVPRGRRFEDLFYRALIEYTPAEMAEIDRFLPIELNEMADLYRNRDKAYINIPWSGCWDCKFADVERDGQVYPRLCSSMSKGDTGMVAHMLKHTYTTREDDLDAEEATDDTE